MVMVEVQASEDFDCNSVSRSRCNQYTLPLVSCETMGFSDVSIQIKANQKVNFDKMRVEADKIN